MMDGCDTLLMIGTGFPWSEFLPKTGQARAVQIDIDPTMLGIRYPDRGQSARRRRRNPDRALLPLLDQKAAGPTGASGIAEAMSEWWALMDRRAHAPASPVNPQRVAWELSPRLPANAIITSDSGSCANWYARDIKIRRGMMCSLSGGLASMGAAVPYAIGAKFAHPDRPVIALVGDGAMQMNNMAELITVAKYWRGMVEPSMDLLRLEQRGPQPGHLGTAHRRRASPKLETTQSIPNVPYHRFAELIGLRGIYVDDPEQVGAAWDAALAANEPVVIEVKTDPEIPPLPPHITMEQAKKLLSTLHQGDPDMLGLIKGAASQILA